MNKLFTKIAALVLGMMMAVGVGVAVGTRQVAKRADADVVAGETSYVFAEHSDYAGWDSSYSKHTLSYSTGVDIIFSSANNQSTTSSASITDRPVTKGQPVELKLPENSAFYISAFTFNALKWGNKSQTIKAHYSTNRGTSYTEISGNSTNFTISKASADMGTSTSVNAIKITFSNSSNQVGLTSFVVTYTARPSTSYTVSYNANGLGGDQMADSTGSSITLKDNAYTVPTGAKFLCWNTAEDGSGIDYNPKTVVTENLTLYAKWGYEITYKANGSGEEDVVKYTNKNTAYTIEKNTFKYEGYSFTKWNTNSSGTGTDYLEDAVVSTPSAALTLFAQWEVETAKIDIINKAFTGNPSGYTNWSGKSGSASSAVYAGNSAGNNDSVQMRSSDNSGIISTTTGGIIKKVEVTWNDNTASGRILDIYGKDEAYKSVSELHNDTSKGTLLGSIEYGTSTTATISSGKPFIGMRIRSGGAAFLTTIKVYWEPITSFKVKYDLNGGTVGTVPSTVENLSEDDLKTFTVASIPSDFYKFGYTCDGWTSTQSGSKEYTPNTQYDLSGKISGDSVTLYAHWSAKTLTGLTAGSTSPTTKIYEVGQTFDPTGLTIHAIFNDTEEDTTDITSQVEWPALEKGNSITGSFTIGTTTVYITITGLTITGPDVVIKNATVPANVPTSNNTSTLTGYIGSIQYEYYTLQKYNSNLEFNRNYEGYLANLDSYGKYISSIKITLDTDNFSKFTLYKGDDAKPTTTSVSATGSGTVRTYNLGNDSEYFNFKLTETGTWVQIVSIEVYLGSDVPEKIVNTVAVNDPGIIYDGDSKQLTATVTYVDSSKTDSNVTWSKVSGTSSITEQGMFTASGTTSTVVRATSVLENAQGQHVSAEFTITPQEKMIISGHRYFVVSSNNDIFLAKNLDGTYGTSSNISRESFLSSATLSSDGKYVVSIEGVSTDSLEDYAWIMTEGDSSKYTFKNTGGNYFNIFQSGSFYVDSVGTGSQEPFTFSEIESSGFYSVFSTKTNTYLNISNDTFDTSSDTASTGYRFIEYKEFGTLDHIEIDETHSKKEYFMNDTFDISDVLVIAFDTNGMPKALSSGYTCTGYNMSVPGKQTVTVTYSEKTDSYDINVIKWRSVKEEGASITGIFDFSKGTAQGTGFDATTLGERYESSDGLLAPTISGITALYDGNGSGGAIQGSGFARIGKSGSVTFTFGLDTEITSVKMGLRSWSSTEDATISVTNCESYTTSNGDYVDHTFTLSETTNKITISTNSARAFIDKITITAGGEKEIGKTADCLGLEAYIDTYLHMSDYPGTEGQEGPGWCKDNEHNYYGKNTTSGAKYHFNQLNSHQRELLSTNSAYTAEWKRLSAWAAANGDTLDSNSQLSAVKVPSIIETLGLESNNATTIVVIVSVVSLTAIGGYFFLKKRREQN